MIASVGFKEIIDFVKGKFGANVNISKASDRALNIGYKLTVCKLSITEIVVKISIQEVGNDRISLSYECNTGLSLILSGVVSLLNKEIPDAVRVDTEQRYVQIVPKRIKGLDKALEYLKLSDIIIDDDAIRVIVTAV